MKKEQNWKNDDNTGIIAVDTSFREKKIITSPLWFILHFLIILGTIFLGIKFYNSAPEKMPVKFDFDGNILATIEKNYNAIFYMPIIQIFLLGVFVLVYVTISRAKQQISSKNSKESIEKNRTFRYSWSVFMVFTGIAMQIMLLVSQLAIFGLIENLLLIIYIIVLIPVCILVVSIILSIKLGQGGSRVKNRKNNKEIQRDDDKHWRLGMFYYNKDDPSLFIEKRFGVGWTNNWARPISWIIIISILLFSIGIIFLPNLLNLK